VWIIYEQEGRRGLFKGLGTALVNVPLFWSIYWYCYEHMKLRLQDDFSHLSSLSQHILSAAIAGGVADVVTNPFWVVRTRIQTLALHPDHVISAPTISTYKMFRTIYQKEGFLAFYKGLTASLLGLPHVAIQFPLYEYLKQYSCQRSGLEQPTMSHYFAASAFAKLTASLFTYPHEVLRARLQDDRHATRSPSILGLTRSIVQQEGWRALYSGFKLNMIRIIPSTTSSFITYEYVSKYLKERDDIWTEWDDEEF
jgi:solute carrier family 25 (mitochondrial folate transporter), member 32